MKDEAAGSRLTAPSQWAARYGGVMSPKSLSLWLTDKFTRVTVFTAQGDSSSGQNQGPLEGNKNRQCCQTACWGMNIQTWKERWRRGWCCLEIWHRHTRWQSSAKCFATTTTALQFPWCEQPYTLFTGSIHSISNDVCVHRMQKKKKDAHLQDCPTEFYKPQDLSGSQWPQNDKIL